MQGPIWHEYLQIDTGLVFIDDVLRDLDDHGENLGGAIADGEFRIVVRHAPFLVPAQEQKKNSYAVIIRPISGGA